MDKRLTDRQREIILLRAHGLTTPAVAQKLTIDQTTVNQHIRRVCRNLNAVSEVHAFTLLQKSGEISLDDVPQPTALWLAMCRRP